MPTEVIQLLTGMLGSLGFAMVFHQKLRFLPLAALGGFLNWGAYLLLLHLMGRLFVACLLAAAIAALYSEFLARRLHAPAIVFLAPSIIPSVPGSHLYYMMEEVLRGDFSLAGRHTLLLGQWAFGIAAGVSVVAVSLVIYRGIRTKGAKN